MVPNNPVRQNPRNATMKFVIIFLLACMILQASSRNGPDRVFKVTDLGVVVSRGSGNDISRVPRFAAPDLRNGEYLQLA
uniref:Uncharacterized protein n=1 Tax=Magallana gigas TaxID=29159 RepID=K1RX41_MAGGI